MSTTGTANIAVVGMGQGAAGDDAVGFAVIDALRKRHLPPGVALLCASDALELVPLLEEADVLLVDGAFGSPPGVVMELGPDALAHEAPPLSSHRTSPAEAIALARALARRGASPRIRIVAITVEPPKRPRIGLSPAVAEAVPKAAAHILALLGTAVDFE